LNAVTSRGVLDFDFIVVATGNTSLVSKKLGIEKVSMSRVLISNYIRLAASDGPSEPCFSLTKEYWVYVAPIGNGLYSITFCSLKKGIFNIMEFIRQHFSMGFRVLLNKGYETSWSLTKIPSFRNLFFVGDAFLSFDPTSSKGILKALLSGMMAAHILECTSNNSLSPADAQSIYQAWGLGFIKREIEALKELLPPAMGEALFSSSYPGPILYQA
jgi:flavin-dependent dehydrogenase